MAVSSDAPADSKTGPSMPGSLRALRNMVIINAAIYMNTNPGPDDSICNMNCHPQFHKLIKGAQFDFEELYNLNAILEYRMEKNKLGELYCFALDIGVPNDKRLADTDDYKWRGALLFRGGDNRDREDGEAAVAILDRYEAICHWIREFQIFPLPQEGQGDSYVKPNTYLAIRLAETSFTLEEIRMKLEDLKQLKLEKAKHATSLSVVELQYEGKEMKDRISFVMYIKDCLQRSLATGEITL